LIALYVSLIHELMGAGYGSYLPPGSEWDDGWHVGNHTEMRRWTP